MTQVEFISYIALHSTHSRLNDICIQAGKKSVAELIQASFSTYKLAQDAYANNRHIYAELDEARREITPTEFLDGTLEFIVSKDFSDGFDFEKLRPFAQQFFEEFQKTRKFLHIKFFKLDGDYAELLQSIAEADDNSYASALKQAISFFVYMRNIYDSGGRVLVESETGELKELQEFTKSVS